MSGLPVTDPHATPTGTRRLVAPELLPVLEMLPAFDFTAESLPQIRMMAAQRPMPPLSPEQQAVRCEEQFVPGPPGAPDVRLLLYRPAGEAKAPRPAFLHMHGGGYVIGSPDSNDALNRSIAAGHGCVVASVDYRLAPETPYPGAVEDCHAALVWLHREADRLGVDRGRIAIGGESAGGGHAAALTLLARDRGEVPICFQLLDCPMLDDRTGTASSPDPHPYCGEFVWTPAHNRFGWGALLGMEPGGSDVPAHAAPARVANLSGLPPAFIAVGAMDLFLEENLEYARRLIRAGVPTELHVTPGAFHGYEFLADAPQVDAHWRAWHQALARAFNPPVAPDPEIAYSPEMETL